MPSKPKSKSLPKFSGHVLLVEDSADNQLLVSILLRRLGVRVTCAQNGQVAVEYAGRRD